MHHSEGEGVSDPDSDVHSPDPSTTVHQGMFMLDMSPIDKREQEMVSNFSMSCDCKLGSNNDVCSNQFSKDHFSFYVNNCSEMSLHELDLIILTAISCSHSPPCDSSCGAKTKYIIYPQQQELRKHWKVKHIAIKMLFRLQRKPGNTHCAQFVVTIREHPLSNRSLQLSCIFIHK